MTPALALVPETAGAPLGADAMERPSREEWQALWDAACRLPVPDYPAVALARLDALEHPCPR